MYASDLPKDPKIVRCVSLGCFLLDPFHPVSCRNVNQTDDPSGANERAPIPFPAACGLAFYPAGGDSSDKQCHVHFFNFLV